MYTMKLLCENLISKGRRVFEIVTHEEKPLPGTCCLGPVELVFEKRFF